MAFSEFGELLENCRLKKLTELKCKDFQEIDIQARFFSFHISSQLLMAPIHLQFLPGTSNTFEVHVHLDDLHEQLGFLKNTLLESALWPLIVLMRSWTHAAWTHTELDTCGTGPFANAITS